MRCESVTYMSSTDLMHKVGTANSKGLVTHSISPVITSSKFIVSGLEKIVQ